MELVINVRCYLQVPITGESKSLFGVSAAPPRSTYFILRNLPSPTYPPFASSRENISNLAHFIRQDYLRGCGLVLKHLIVLSPKEILLNPLCSIQQSFTQWLSCQLILNSKIKKRTWLRIQAELILPNLIQKPDEKCLTRYSFEGYGRRDREMA